MNNKCQTAFIRKDEAQAPDFSHEAHDCAAHAWDTAQKLAVYTPSAPEVPASSWALTAVVEVAGSAVVPH